jgi:hypothetical protein
MVACSIFQSIKTPSMYVDSWIYAPDMNFARPSFVEELLQQKFRSEVSVTLNRKRLPARVVHFVTWAAALGGGARWKGNSTAAPGHVEMTSKLWEGLWPSETNHFLTRALEGTKEINLGCWRKVERKQEYSRTVWNKVVKNVKWGALMMIIGWSVGDSKEKVFFAPSLSLGTYLFTGRIGALKI